MRCFRSVRWLCIAAATTSPIVVGCQSQPISRNQDEESGQASKGDWRSVHEVMALISQVRPWPGPSDEPDYGKEDWVVLVRTALTLQEVDPDVLECAFHDYVIHFATAFEEGVDCQAEWSKILLLLRAMFVLPQDKVTSDCYGVMAFGGFGWIANPPLVETPATVAVPIHWGADGPILVARRMGYNGAAYAADKEYRYFLKHFQLRMSLYRSLEKLQGGAERGCSHGEK